MRQVILEIDTAIIREQLSVWDDMADVAKDIDAAVVDAPPISLRDGGLINLGYRDELDRLRRMSQDAKSWLRSYEEEERARTGIKHLKIVYNKVFGYCIEVNKREEAHVPPEYTRRQTLTNAERYVTPELKKTEEEVLEADSRARDMEYEIFQDVRAAVLAETDRIQSTARRLASLDCTLDLCRKRIPPAICRAGGG